MADKLTRIRILNDWIIPLTEEEQVLVSRFGLDNVYDLPAVPPGTEVEAYIDSKGRAHYNYPERADFAPWFSDKDDYEVVDG